MPFLVSTKLLFCFFVVVVVLSDFLSPFLVDTVVVVSPDKVVTLLLASVCAVGAVVGAYFMLSHATSDKVNNTANIKAIIFVNFDILLPPKVF